MSRSSAAAPRRARPGRGARRRPRRSRPGSRRARPAPPRVGSAGNGCSRLPPNRTTAIALPQIAHDRNTNRHRTRPAVPAGPARSPSVASRPAGIVPAPMLLDGRREREQPCRHRPDAVVHLDRVGVRAARPTWCAASTWTVELDERWVILGPNGAGKTACCACAGGGLPASLDRHRASARRAARAPSTCSRLRPRDVAPSAALARPGPPARRSPTWWSVPGYAVVGPAGTRSTTPADHAAHSGLLRPVRVAGLARADLRHAVGGRAQAGADRPRPDDRSRS